MKTTILASMAIALAGTAATAAADAETGTRIKRLETVVTETDAKKPAVVRPATGSRVKRLEDVSVLTDADKTGAARRSAGHADVEALLSKAEAAEAVH
jgi:hypothetical protein